MVKGTAISRILLTVVATVLLVAGTSLAQAESITFWLMPNAADAIHIPWLDAKTEEFFEETGIRVRYEIVGWGDAWARISTALITGEGVDVFQAGTTWNRKRQT